MNLILIAAQAANKVIDNLPDSHENATLFLVTDKPVIMGRKTYDQLGRPLPGRPNIVLSKTLKLSEEGVHVVTSVKQALKSLQLAGFEEAYVIGGGEVFMQFMPWACKLILTQFYKSVQGETVFPDIDPRAWKLTNRIDKFEGTIPYSILMHDAAFNPDLKWVDLIKD